jgi:hypothetical protein
MAPPNSSSFSVSVVLPASGAAGEFFAEFGHGWGRDGKSAPF